MTSRTFTETGIGNTYQDWKDRAQALANQWGYAWIVEFPPGIYSVVVSGDFNDRPYPSREQFIGELQPTPLVGPSTEDRIARLEQQVAELQAQLEMRH